MGTALRAHRAGDCVAEKYRLIRLLDVGGMGAVWVAHHLALDVHVAVKFILPDSGSPEAAARLLQEAQAAARVRHPAIVRVFDVGRTPDDEAYLAMELLEGEALAGALCREQRLEPGAAIRVLLPIAEALDALHRRGIIHRDVKPENIFLARDDAGYWQPKLIDFGLARSTAPDARRITATGAVMGTPVYMSRERLLGEDVDFQEDVWALSVVLYRAITGELPFDGRDPMLLLAALTENRPRSILDYGVGDADLWAILERGFAPRGERWASAWDLGKALAGWLRQNGSPDDVSGVSLRPIWIDADDVRHLAGTVRSRVPAITGTPRRHALAALGVILAAAVILTWARPLPDSARPASAAAEVDPSSSVATASALPVAGRPTVSITVASTEGAPKTTPIFGPGAPRAVANPASPPRTVAPGRRAPRADVPPPLKNPYR